MSDLKFNCPHCQQSLEAPEEMLGTVIDCPTCNGNIQLPSPQRPAEPEPQSTEPPPVPKKKVFINTRKETATQSPPKAQEPSKGFFGKLKEMADKAQSKLNCSQCGAKLNLGEMGTKMGCCSKCALQQSHLLPDPSERLEFCQSASYREGHRERPQEAKDSGLLYICANHICFIDNSMKWTIAYEDVTKIDLDYFKPSGLRAVLAGGAVGMQLQRVRNYLCITYIDAKRSEWTIKFQVHGALSIPGEENKAVEVMGFINKYKERFGRAVSNAASSTGQVDPLTQIQKLAELKAQGVISEEDFQDKKQQLLAKL